MSGTLDLQCEIIKGIEDIKSQISTSEYNMRYRVLDRLPKVFLRQYKPLLTDPGFKSSTMLFLLIPALYGMKNAAHLITRESVDRVSRLNFAMTLSSTEDLLAEYKNREDANEAMDELRRLAVMSTDEQLEVILQNLPTVISFMRERNADHSLILDTLPTLVQAPALAAGLL